MSGTPDYIKHVVEELDKRVNTLENNAALEITAAQKWLAKHTYVLCAGMLVLGYILGHVWR